MEDTWRALFRKYMAHVIDCEGVSFIPGNYERPRIPFTADELRMLGMLEREAIEEYKKGESGTSD
jgi:hypothetical protein